MFASAAFARSPLRRQVFYWRDRQRSLLPSDLSCTDREREECPLLPECRRRGGSRFSSVPALPSGEFAGNSGMDGNFKHGLESSPPDWREWIGRRWSRGLSGTPGSRCTPPSAFVFKAFGSD